MTTDKPGAVAVAAGTTISERHGMSVQAENDTIAIIQAAIDEATAAVVAERDAIRDVRDVYADKLQEARAAARELGTRLNALSAAEASYRGTHDLHGDGHRDTGRAWDRMRRESESACEDITKNAALLAEPEGRDRGAFVGEAKPLVKQDYERAADRLGCEVAAIRAVAKVESGGRSGFFKDGRPKILFESRWFHKLTGGKYDASHSHISTSTWVRNYAGGAAEYARLEEAIALDRDAALKSASWGTFQILGVNYDVCGFANVEDYVEAQLVSEGAHLDAFVAFVMSKGLDGELRDRRWADFAMVYNGAGYKKNRYDTKMADAYFELTGGASAPSTAEIQFALNMHGADLKVDGLKGPKTRAAISAFQEREGLPISGQPDQATLAALGLGERETYGPTTSTDGDLLGEEQKP